MGSSQRNHNTPAVKAGQERVQPKETPTLLHNNRSRKNSAQRKENTPIIHEEHLTAQQPNNQAQHIRTRVSRLSLAIQTQIITKPKKTNIPNIGKDDYRATRRRLKNTQNQHTKTVLRWVNIWIVDQWGLPKLADYNSSHQKQKHQLGLSLAYLLWIQNIWQRQTTQKLQNNCKAENRE